MVVVIVVAVDFVVVAGFVSSLSFIFSVICFISPSLSVCVSVRHPHLAISRILFRFNVFFFIRSFYIA